jgi:hypothetical protein
MKQWLSIGDRIQVSDEFFWAKGATGRIAAPPDAVTALSGPWDDGLTRRENSSLGTNTVYWVWLRRATTRCRRGRPVSRRINLGKCVGDHHKKRELIHSNAT